MSKFHVFCSVTDAFLTQVNRSISSTVSWLVFVMAITTTSIVIVRSVLDLGSVGAQESLTYMHAMVIMLASAYAFKLDGHVRVDIFYRRFDSVGKAWVNALGCSLFLLPLALFTIAISWEYVAQSWGFKETSADAGGIPAVYLLKSLLLAFGVLLAFQAIAELLRNVLQLTFTNHKDA